MASWKVLLGFAVVFFLCEALKAQPPQPEAKAEAPHFFIESPQYQSIRNMPKVSLSGLHIAYAFNPRYHFGIEMGTDKFFKHGIKNAYIGGFTSNVIPISLNVFSLVSGFSIGYFTQSPEGEKGSTYGGFEFSVQYDDPARHLFYTRLGYRAFLFTDSHRPNITSLMVSVGINF